LGRPAPAKEISTFALRPKLRKIHVPKNKRSASAGKDISSMPRHFASFKIYSATGPNV